MTQVDIVVGSMLGASEYVADALKALLEEHDYQATIHLSPDIKDLAVDSILLICTSTHGAGDYPDNIQSFASSIEKKPANLNGRHFLLIGLGDSSYDTFCEAGKNLFSMLNSAGARPLTDPLYIDVLEHAIPEEHATEWLQNWLSA